MNKTPRRAAVLGLIILGLFLGAQPKAMASGVTPVTLNASADTFISEHAAFGGPTGVNGLDNKLWLLRGISGLHRCFPLVQFDLTPYAGRTVSGPTAELVLYFRGGYAGLHVSQSVSVRESLVGWDETTASFENFGGTGFNEATQTGVALVTKTVTYPGGLAPVAFEIPSSVVQRWIDDPSSNHGLFLISNTSQMLTDLTFWSKDAVGELEPGPELSFAFVSEATNSPPILECVETTTAECGSLLILEAQVADTDGDTLTAVWAVNGMLVQTNMAMPRPGDSETVSLAVEDLPLGTNVVTIALSDGMSPPVECESLVIVQDTQPPEISDASVTPNILWPPDNKLVDVHVQAIAHDACGFTTWQVVKIEANEPLNAEDFEFADEAQVVSLRAKRLGKGEGRTYTLWLRATDEAGNDSEAVSVEVTVPHDQGGKKR